MAAEPPEKLDFSMVQQLDFDSLVREDNIDEDEYNMSSLHRAIWNNKIEEAEKLLAEAKESGEKPLRKLLKKVDVEGRPPLIYTVIQKNLKLFKALIEHGAPLEWVSVDQGFNCLFYLIFHQFNDGAAYLLNTPNLKGKVSLDQASTTKKPATPLLFASAMGRAQIASLLLQNGASIKAKYNPKGDHMFNPLLVCIHSKDIENTIMREATAQVLLENGCDFNAQRADGCTPLVCCINFGMTDTAKLLLERGAMLDRCANDGYTTALWMAMYRSNTQISSLLTSKDAKVNSGLKKSTPLHAAVAAGFTSGIVDLLAKDASIEEKSADGFTPLHLAVIRPETEALQLLLNKVDELQKEFYQKQEEIKKQQEEEQRQKEEQRRKEKEEIRRKKKEDRKEEKKAKRKRSKSEKEERKKTKGSSSRPKSAELSREKSLTREKSSDGKEEIDTEAKEANDESKNSPRKKDSAAESSEITSKTSSDAKPEQPVILNGEDEEEQEEEEQKEDADPLLQKPIAPIDIPSDNGGFSALHIACINGNLPAAKLLLQHKADVEAISVQDKLTPFLCTMMEPGHEALGEFILSNGAKITTRRGTNGIPPLVNAVALQRRSFVSIICAKAKAECDKAGELKKQGGGTRSKAWKKRWFVMKGPYMMYYKSHTQQEPQGFLVMDGAHQEDSPKGELNWQLVTSRRTFQLMGNTVEEVKEWRQAIDKNISECPSHTTSLQFDYAGKMPTLPQELLPNSTTAAQPSTSNSAAPKKGSRISGFFGRA